MGALDARAAASVAARARARELLAADALPSRDVAAIVRGRPASARDDAATDRAVRCFARAGHDGARAPRLDVPWLLRTHRRLLPGERSLRTGPARTGPARFRAPPADRVPSLLADLAAFLDRTDLCPVAQAGVAFAQLTFIHPFPDGNGRVGRCLFQVVLRRRGVVRVLAPPLGPYLVANAAAFAGAHGRFRRGHVDDWLAFMDRAVIAGGAAALTVLDVTPPAGQGPVTPGRPAPGRGLV